MAMNPADAHLLKDTLEGEGIEVFVEGKFFL
jgi:hypothetical protein